MLAHLYIPGDIDWFLLLAIRFPFGLRRLLEHIQVVGIIQFCCQFVNDKHQATLRLASGSVFMLNSWLGCGRPLLKLPA